MVIIAAPCSIRDLKWSLRAPFVGVVDFFRMRAALPHIADENAVACKDGKSFLLQLLRVDFLKDVNHQSPADSKKIEQFEYLSLSSEGFGVSVFKKIKMPNGDLETSEVRRPVTNLDLRRYIRYHLSSSEREFGIVAALKQNIEFAINNQNFFHSLLDTFTGTFVKPNSTM